VLSIQGLNQFYSGSHILWDVNLDVPEGSCTCLMGRNGMGKTTLLKCIMGLLPIASGAMSYGLGAESTDLAKQAADRRARLGIAYVPQGARDLLAAHRRGKSARRFRGEAWAIHQ
jgi:urea transport system ATP-binding protein